MKLRLAYRIASMTPRTPDPSMMEAPLDREVMLPRLRQEAEWIARVPHFNLDNVADFYASHDRQVWDMSEDVPNWAPPFGGFFAEWNEPEAWNMQPGAPPRASGGAQAGFAVLSAHVTDENRQNLDSWLLLIGSFLGYKGCRSLGEQEPPVREALQGARWLLCCDEWGTMGGAPLHGAPLWMGTSLFVFVSPEGRCLHTFAAGLTVPAMYSLRGRDSIFSPLHILGLGLSFCHCKNVRKVEAEEDVGARWHRRTQVPRLRFYTLEIGPMREVLRREGRSEEVGIKRALHICRGHFATYTPEHPLFGKYAGTFWRPDHVRGSREAGEVHKRYRVEKESS